MIHLMKDQIPVRFLCNYFSVSISGYYKWCKRHELESLRKKCEICSKIKEIFHFSKKTYGSPRVHKELLEKGFKISESTVAKYMNELNLSADQKRNLK